MSKLLSTIIIFIITIIFIFMLVLPKYHQSQQLGQVLLVKQQQYNTQALHYQKIADLNSTIEGDSEVFARVRSALPSSPSFASLVYFIQQKASENGLIVKSIAFSQPIPSSALSKVVNINFNVDVLGTYQGFKGFLSALDNSSRLFEVNSLSFSSSQSSLTGQKAKNVQPIYDFSLTIQTHSY